MTDYKKIAQCPECYEMCTPCALERAGLWRLSFRCFPCDFVWRWLKPLWPFRFLQTVHPEELEAKGFTIVQGVSDEPRS